MRVEDRTQLEMLQRQCRDRKDGYTCRILVCAGTGCVATGSLDVYSQLRELCKEDEGIRVELEKDVPHIGIVKSGCQGFCELGPLVRIEPQHCQYVKVQPEDCEEIVEKTVKQGIPVERLFYKKEGISYGAVDEIPYFARQTRIVLEQCGNIDAESVEEYMAAGGFSALKKALFAMTPEAVIAEVEFSGLRGRGGGGFPAGRKWRQVAAPKEEPPKYIGWNDDEGDPGAFMDGSVMEGDPCRLIEGMMLAGYAVGASEGFIYVRAEYPLSVARLKQAIGQMEERGLLGDSILGTGFSFHLHINRGAGAFVCGEGSALTASIEGHRGMPRVKPPRTVDQGLWGKPTVLNNVETYANLPGIIVNGGKWFRTIGTENSTGTKTFSVTGCIENTGLVEVPMGTTLRTIIYDICGGLKEGSEFKAVQIGGPSGGCLTEEHLDEPLDFDSVQKFNVIIGSGGLVVMDKNTCMVEVARFFMNFTQRESCGKCVPCREGTKRMLEILERIVEGKGEPDDIERLEQLADMISNTALCGLGKSAPLPVISTIKAFRKEYLEHINEKKCRAGVCQSMKTYIIDEETCRGCSKCAKGCPAGAIAGELKHVFTIRQQQCIKCGACAEACPFGAVHIQS